MRKEKIYRYYGLFWTEGKLGEEMHGEAVIKANISRDEFCALLEEYKDACMKTWPMSELLTDAQMYAEGPNEPAPATPLQEHKDEEHKDEDKNWLGESICVSGFVDFLHKNGVKAKDVSPDEDDYFEF
jgi:hypothetical protein